MNTTFQEVDVLLSIDTRVLMSAILLLSNTFVFSVIIFFSLLTGARFHCLFCACMPVSMIFRKYNTASLAITMMHIWRDL